MNKMEAALKELHRRREAALQMGGPERIKRQHTQGKLTARERIQLLLDPGSFQEYGLLATHEGQRPGEPITPADALVAGVGRIHGRPVAVYAEDATVKGGSVARVNFEKRMRLFDIAATECVPLIGLFDGAGARAQDMLQAPEGVPIGSQFIKLARLSGLVPLIGLIMGPCAGESALEASLMEFNIMVQGTGMLAAGGPPVVKASTGQEISKEELGGTSVHVNLTGLADIAAHDDAHAIALARRYLSYLPSNAYQYPQSIASAPPIENAEDVLLNVLPESERSPYDMSIVVQALVDKDTFFEIKPDFGKTLLAGLARLNGHTVGILANQPAVLAGAVNAAGAQKARKFIDLCGAYHIPIIALVDTPGVMTGPDSEREGALKWGLAAMYARAWADVPTFTVVLRKAFGFGGAVMGGYKTGQTVLFAWPTSDFASLPAESSILSAHRRELEAAEDRQALYQELLERYKAYAGPYPAAGMLNVDDVIDPRETRPRLIQALELVLNRRTRPAQPTLRHGVMP